MGFLKDLLRQPKNVPDTAKQYSSITEYAPSSSTPTFTAYEAGVYGQELTRSCIDRFATACSKLKPEIQGNSHPAIVKAMRTQPNQYDTWPKFLKKVATRYDTDATTYICPVYARDLITKVGFFSMKPEYTEVLEYRGEPWIKFFLATGDPTALPLREVCILSKFPYVSDFFSDDNCISNTMDLIHAQNQAQKNAIENGANIRFIGALNGQVREDDMEKKRERFVEKNLSASNSGGLLIYDQTFSDIKQVEQQSYTISDEEMKRIEDSVFNYFGCNKKILQNDYNEDEWGAWYEGKIEPFAVELGSGLTKMCFTQTEQKRNQISFSSNRLEYASNASKRNMIRDMMDRGVITLNQALEMLQMPTIGPDGDIRVIRGEYVGIDSIRGYVEEKKLPDVSAFDNEEKEIDSDDTRKDTDPAGRDTKEN